MVRDVQLGKLQSAWKSSTKHVRDSMTLSCSIGSTRKTSMIKLGVGTKKTNPTTKQPLLPCLKNIRQRSLIRRRHSLKHLVNPKGCVALQFLVEARWPN
ncbi:hypothetical protein LINPERHAP2_LOCUS33284 [Linum perenne]